MVDRMMEVGTLNCIYFAMVVAGLIYALSLLLLGDLGGDGDVGVDVDVDVAGAGDLSLFSPITIATFITAFGSTGLICTIGFGMGAMLSLVIAFVVATGVSLLVSLVFSRLLVEMHGTTEIRQTDMVGMVGQVTTPIPAGGLGEVLYEIQNERGVKAARSVDDAAIPRGTTIVVDEIIGGVLIVHPRQPRS